MRGRRLDIDGALRIPPRPDWNSVPRTRSEAARDAVERRRAERRRRNEETLARYGRGDGMQHAQMRRWHDENRALNNARSRKWNDENRGLHNALGKDYYRRKRRKRNGGTGPQG